MSRGCAGLLRLSYSHRANAMAIFRPVLAHALADLDDRTLRADLHAMPGHVVFWRPVPPNPAASCRLMVDVGNIDGLATPLALQVLFRLRRLGSVPHPAAGSAMQVLGCVIGPRSGMHYRWDGLGKHPCRWVDVHSVSATATSLTDLGLLRSDGTCVSLSDVGQRFLDSLHPDAEDSDVLCRWQRPAVANEDIGARVDDWIMRVFSKCKTRVNRLPRTYPSAAVPA